VNSEDSKLWKKGMVEEMDALDKNEAWDIFQLLFGRKFVGRKWLFKKNFNAKGKVEKYKARLVAKGYSEVKSQLSSKFDMKDIGVANFILG
jgi:hypothetical protein